MESAAERLQAISRLRTASELKAKVHPNALKKVRADAKYVSAGRQEYTIQQSNVGWKIVKYMGGLSPERLKGDFTTFRSAEQTLINYLIQTDKWGKAIYPGCQEQ